MKKIVYFDHAAASVPSPETLQDFASLAGHFYANAEAVHQLAYRSREALKTAEKRVSAALFNRGDHPVIWGESATELFRVLASFPEFDTGCASALEHPALLENLKNFTAADIAAVAPDGTFCSGPHSSRSYDLVCCHQVQSELGLLADTEKFFAGVSPRCRMVDAVQAAGKMPLVRNADVWVISGVKFGSPGGAAMILAADGRLTDKLLAHARNCRQQSYAVSRVNVPMILTMTGALEKAVAMMAENRDKVLQLNSEIRSGVRELGIVPTLPESVPVSPYILNLLLPEQESAVVVRALGEMGIFTASGSACSAETGRPSPALTALGFRAEKAYRALRLSFGPGNSPEDAGIFLDGLKTVLKNY
ncbi:MAG: aminotransferase class V-fold PLP-dependent enzyme [Lentisphaeria bacterium]|nr:aminotransferase class V-fold PLP-dependent enzyme [Lentisphaeria bacterium]